MKESDVLVEVKRNIFLSTHDPGFLRKYLHYRPYDQDKWFDYAKEALQSGNYKAYYERLQKAADLGHYEARRALRPPKALPLSPTPPRKNYALVLPILLIIFLFLLSFGLTYFLVKNHYIQQVMIKDIRTQSSTLYYEETEHNIVPFDDKAKSVAGMSLYTAIQSFKQDHGSYPTIARDLIDQAPSNYLSTLPQNYIYSKTQNGFKLQSETSSLQPTSNIPSLELWFYPDTNHLSIGNSNGQTLASYRVGSGAPLPFRSSTVSGRVVNPNGGKDVYGTRGLALQDQYAIHGTNDPSSIGSYVSKGCIRMNNDDMEILFEYIPLGTPFIVKEGSPSSPLFITGLPPFPGNGQISPAEFLPGTTVTWRD